MNKLEYNFKERTNYTELIKMMAHFSLNILL